MVPALRSSPAIGLDDRAGLLDADQTVASRSTPARRGGRALERECAHAAAHRAVGRRALYRRARRSAAGKLGGAAGPLGGYRSHQRRSICQGVGQPARRAAHVLRHEPVCRRVPRGAGDRAGAPEVAGRADGRARALFRAHRAGSQGRHRRALGTGSPDRSRPAGEPQSHRGRVGHSDDLDHHCRSPAAPFVRSAECHDPPAHAHFGVGAGGTTSAASRANQASRRDALDRLEWDGSGFGLLDHRLGLKTRDGKVGGFDAHFLRIVGRRRDQSTQASIDLPRGRSGRARRDRLAVRAAARQRRGGESDGDPSRLGGVGRRLALRRAGRSARCDSPENARGMVGQRRASAFRRRLFAHGRDARRTCGLVDYAAASHLGLAAVCVAIDSFHQRRTRGRPSRDHSSGQGGGRYVSERCERDRALARAGQLGGASADRHFDQVSSQRFSGEFRHTARSLSGDCGTVVAEDTAAQGAGRRQPFAGALSPAGVCGSDAVRDGRWVDPRPRCLRYGPGQRPALLGRASRSEQPSLGDPRRRCGRAASLPFGNVVDRA